LVIVPDGALHQLPFEALMWPADEDTASYVLDHCPPIAYAPSARILAVLRRRDRTETAGRCLLTVGKSTFAPRSLADRTASGAGTQMAKEELAGPLRPLVAARPECVAVAAACRRAGFYQIECLLDAEATERHVREHVAQATVLHFATHAIVDSERDNFFGRLELTPPGTVETAEDDGFLELREIHGLPLKSCDLAVLSACGTNLGPDRPLEVGSTMSRVFFAAGAQRVVCSLWPVNDDSTAQLIGAFFDNLQKAWNSGQPVDYAAALQKARQTVRQSGFPEPYHWAPFILIGPADESKPPSTRLRGNDGHDTRVLSTAGSN
jgi:CHAT domain-containing protein